MAYSAKVVRKVDDVPEDLRDEINEDFFSEGRSLLVIDYGTRRETHSDRGEPEDNSFGRDYYWVERPLTQHLKPVRQKKFKEEYAMSAPQYPEGGYIGKVVQQALVKSKNKGTPQLVIRFTVESKADGGDSGPRRERTMYRVITANTTQYVQEDLAKLGFTGTSISEVDPNSPKFSFDLTGKEINLYCKHEADQESNLGEKWQLSRTFAIEGEPVTDYDSLDAMFDFTAKPKVAAPKQSKPAAGKPNGSAATVAELTDDELAAKVVELVRSKGNTLPKKSLGVNLLTLKLQRDDIKKAQSEEFLQAFNGVVWKYDGTAITVE